MMQKETLKKSNYQKSVSFSNISSFHTTPKFDMLSIFCEITNRKKDLEFTNFDFQQLI